MDNPLSPQLGAGLPKAVHPIYGLAAAKANEIEAELKKLGRWSEQETAPAELLEGMGAFGQGKISFERWLQWVLIPRVREMVEKRGDFPAESEVGVYAIRNLDGDEDAHHLIGLLGDFDRLFYEYRADLDWDKYLKKVLRD